MFEDLEIIRDFIKTNLLESELIYRIESIINQDSSYVIIKFENSSIYFDIETIFKTENNYLKIISLNSTNTGFYYTMKKLKPDHLTNTNTLKLK